MGSYLAPGFLVASPSLLDPHFRRSVVLLVEHRDEGSLGFVINRPGEVTLPEVVEALGLDSPEAAAPDAQVVVGGPVAPETGWIVCEHEVGAALAQGELVRVSAGLAVSASRDLLIALLQAQSKSRMLLALGYAGWGPGQLDQEIAQGAWIPVDLDESIVFHTLFEERWGAALKTLGIDPARLTVVGPGMAS